MRTKGDKAILVVSHQSIIDRIIKKLTGKTYSVDMGECYEVLLNDESTIWILTLLGFKAFSNSAKSPPASAKLESPIIFLSKLDAKVLLVVKEVLDITETFISMLGFIEQESGLVSL